VTTLLQMLDVTHHAGDRALFEGIDLTLHDGVRAGLVGHNGSGKSTFLDLLSGTTDPDKGEVIRARRARIGRVEQFLPAAIGRLGLIDAVRHGQDPEIETWAAESILAELGFSAADLRQAAGTLSGGQQNRLMFARAVVHEPDLLLLDEPTNHLDLATLRIFERFLEAYRGGFLLVSHDRAFLDAVTSQTIFLRDGRLYHFDAPYDAARAELEAADEAARRARESEDRKIDSLRASAKRLATWGKVYDNEGLAKRAKNIEKRVERLESERTFVSAGSPLALSVDLGAARAKETVRMEGLNVTPGGRGGGTLFRIEELVLRPGERVALLGANGTGKSSLIRMLTAACRGAGVPGIRVSPQTRLGYYDQELTEARAASSIADFVIERAPVGDHEVRTRLIAAGFPYRDHAKSMQVLSGGERARVLFVVLSLNRPNFLVLDEPTNHIDMDGRMELEAELVGSGAAVLITSHDRRFLDSVAERYLLIRDGRLQVCNDPDAFYDAPEARTAATARAEPGPNSPTAEAEPSPGVLERIVELEALLEADLARKPKFQKPALQAEWRAELAVLYPRLEGSEGYH
jgi:ATP-binding cassette subfamily F protein 3